ncbi:hypothetical protein DPMN_005195 [Dreissena polymorpha]|uniref:Uncharacterized protein n=1 Tax=Dreissena polymorpha TaxID=45954 RepID=A0A9D4MPW1_DREPO|nr:hypothetical protein DPMN_005195 [Dreissena polymorpha]
MLKETLTGSSGGYVGHGDAGLQSGTSTDNTAVASAQAEPLESSNKHGVFNMFSSTTVRQKIRNGEFIELWSFVPKHIYST